MMSSKNKISKLVLAAMFSALALVLPFVTGYIPQIGKALCPMHIPVLLCGFFCGPWYALAVGLIAPLLRFLLFGMPVIFPTGFAMCFELAAYGSVVALLYRALPKKKPYIYVSLIGAMLAGRLVAAVVKVILYAFGAIKYSWEAFIASSFVNAVPGIIVQIVLIPVLVMVLEKYTYKK